MQTGVFIIPRNLLQCYEVSNGIKSGVGFKGIVFYVRNAKCNTSQIDCIIKML